MASLLSAMATLLYSTGLRAKVQPEGYEVFLTSMYYVAHPSV